MRKNRIPAGIIDMHCHILPGMDDGARSMEEALKMLSTAEKEGITHMIATPHYKAGRHNASTQTIQERMRQVKAAAVEKGIHVSLYAGNEVFFYSEMEEGLEEGRILTMNQSPFVLVEFSPGDRYVYIRNALEEVMGMGYSPVLAHAERYECMLAEPENIMELKSMGVRVQINASSVSGEIGRKVKLFTHLLLKRRLVDYIGTDAHGAEKRAPHIKKCKELLYKKYEAEYINALLHENAMRDFKLVDGGKREAYAGQQKR